jgi:hypothetical protein
MVSRNPPRTGDAPSADKGSDETPLAGTTVPEQGTGPLKGFHDAATEYAAALAQIGSRLQDKLHGAAEELAQPAPQAAAGNATDELNSAYRDLVAACQTQDWEKVKSIQSAYLSRVQAQYGDAETAVKNRLTGYTGAVQAAWQDAKSESLSAFQKHIGAVKDSFANLSVENADPAALAAIAQSLAAVAGYAHVAAQTAAACTAPPKT